MGISRVTNDDGLRWYSDGDTRVMSVTTVLQFLDEDTGGLEYWKEQNDGKGNNAHHEHIYWYSGPRGTLCHYQALKKFEHVFDEDDDMWGEEEAESMRKVMEGPADDAFDDASTDLKDVAYSILKNKDVVTSREEYEHLFAGNTRLVDVLHEDLEFFVDAFNTICDELGVDEDSVIRVEKFMLNTEVGYGGQCDLVYEDPHGDVVVADLKTSSGLRQKHRLQSVAYMKAVEAADWGPDEVDRVEVWRIHPDSETWTVHANETPPHAEDIDNYTDEFWLEDKWGDFSYDSIEDMWTTFKELTEEAHEDADS